MCTPAESCSAYLTHPGFLSYLGSDWAHVLQLHASSVIVVVLLQNEKLIVDEFLDKVAAASRGVSCPLQPASVCITVIRPSSLLIINTTSEFGPV